MKPASFLRASLSAPVRELLLIPLLALALAIDLVRPAFWPLLAALGSLGALPTLLAAITRLRMKKVGIDVFNVFAVVVSFATRELRSAAFIALMLCFARLLDWRTESRTKGAIQEILKLKPLRASRVRGQAVEDVGVDDVRRGDILLVRNGGRVPVDGRIVYGQAHFNESSVTGESALVPKGVGGAVVSGTLVEAGTVKIEATAVGAESTIERMAALMKEASEHKSRSEKQADRFAALFLPFVAFFGLAVWLWTGDIAKMAAIFLVACADDMAVAIPLAMTASLGLAARRGVIVKGGEWFEALRRLEILVLDKTGTLTYGELTIRDVHPEPWIAEPEFLRLVSSAEKFSEHPVGKAVCRAVGRQLGTLPDPQAFSARKGSGIVATVEGREIIAGNERILDELGIALPEEASEKFKKEKEEHGQTTVMVLVDRVFAGLITVADAPRPEAAEALRRLKAMGLRIVMFTGDNAAVAADVARTLGIDEVRASMRPEDKLVELEKLSARHAVGMVGDGINDAPALARADIGIAMGGAGTAVAVEAADVVILTDDLSRLPEMIDLSRRTGTVIRNDIAIWVATNLFGFALVLTGFLGPALAAAYNFLTDFLPLINSSVLFRAGKRRGA